MTFIRANAAPQVTMVQILTVARALELYARTGIRVNGAYMPKRMLAFAKEVTGTEFKGQTKYTAAAQALRQKLEDMEALAAQ